MKCFVEVLIQGILIPFLGSYRTHFVLIGFLLIILFLLFYSSMMCLDKYALLWNLGIINLPHLKVH